MITIRTFLGALCLLLCTLGAAHAQPALPLSACTPVAPPQVASLQMGVHIALVCAHPSRPAPYAVGLSCLHAVCNKDTFIASIVRVAVAPDRASAIDLEWSANVKWTCDAPPNDRAQALCAERKAWIAANWAAWTKVQP